MNFKEVSLNKHRDETQKTCLVTWKIQVENLNDSDVKDCKIKTNSIIGFNRVRMPDDERALKVSVANNILTISYRIDEFYDFNEKGAIELSISNGSTFQVDISHAYLDDPSNESDVIKPVKP